jgi:predicted nucleotidyltransferase
MKIENMLRVVEALGTNPAEGFNINRISKLSKTSVATVYRMLKEMEKRKEVIGTEKGNNIFYRLNLKNPNTMKYCELSSIERRRRFLAQKPELYGEFSGVLDKLHVAILFGSTARMERNARDIDLLLLGHDLPVGETEKLASGTRISPVYMEYGEFSEKMKSGESLVLEIIRDGVVIKGEHEYWDLIGRSL